MERSSYNSGVIIRVTLKLHVSSQILGVIMFVLSKSEAMSDMFKCSGNEQTQICNLTYL